MNNWKKSRIINDGLADEPIYNEILLLISFSKLTVSEWIMSIDCNKIVIKLKFTFVFFIYFSIVNLPLREPNYEAYDDKEWGTDWELEWVTGKSQ